MWDMMNGIAFGYVLFVIGLYFVAAFVCFKCPPLPCAGSDDVTAHIANTP